jgi:hypothetical protein
MATKLTPKKLHAHFENQNQNLGLDSSLTRYSDLSQRVSSAKQRTTLTPTTSPKKRFREADENRDPNLSPTKSVRVEVVSSPQRPAGQAKRSLFFEDSPPREKPKTHAASARSHAIFSLLDGDAHDVHESDFAALDKVETVFDRHRAPLKDEGKRRSGYPETAQSQRKALQELSLNRPAPVRNLEDLLNESRSAAPGSPERDRPKPTAKETPEKTRKMIAFLETVSTEEELIDEDLAIVKNGMAGLSKMDDTPTRKHKARTAEKAHQAVIRNLTSGAAPGSLEFHRNGSKALPLASDGIKREVLTPLAKVQRACKFTHASSPAIGLFWNPDHALSAQKKGKATVGLHFFTKDFSEKYVIHDLIEHPFSGICGIYYSMKGEKEPKPKFSTMFPKDLLGFEDVMKLVDHATPICQSGNRVLFEVEKEKSRIGIEVFLREGGLIKHSVFPVFALMNYQPEARYVLTKDACLSSAELLELASKAIAKVNPYVAEQNSPLRYLIQTGKSVEFVIDIASLVPLKIPQGILVRIASDAFADRKKVSAIIKAWD